MNALRSSLLPAQARFTVAVDSFLKAGFVSSLQEGNLKENIFTFPWVKDKPFVLGPRFKDAFQDPLSYFMVKPLFEKERYIVTAKGKVYALLKDQANSDDILKAAFLGQVLLHSIRSEPKKHASLGKNEETDALCSTATPMDIEAQVAESCKVVLAKYGLFKDKAAHEGWLMSESLLNPG